MIEQFHLEPKEGCRRPVCHPRAVDASNEEREVTEVAEVNRQVATTIFPYAFRGNG